jgi:hypothetical protein
MSFLTIRDENLAAISDSKIVLFGRGNRGD